MECDEPSCKFLTPLHEGILRFINDKIFFDGADTGESMLKRTCVDARGCTMILQSDI